MLCSFQPEPKLFFLSSASWWDNLKSHSHTQTISCDFPGTKPQSVISQPARGSRKSWSAETIITIANKSQNYYTSYATISEYQQLTIPSWWTIITRLHGLIAGHQTLSLVTFSSNFISRQLIVSTHFLSFTKSRLLLYCQFPVSLVKLNVPILRKWNAWQRKFDYRRSERDERIYQI